MKDNIRIAIVQPKPYPSFDDPRNIGHALQLLEKCRGEKLDLICFPEFFPFIGDDEIAAAARQHNAYIVAGLVESDGDRLYDTATLINRDGRIMGRQRKFNITELERTQLGISPGDGIFRAFVTDFGKIGMPVGIDLWGRPEAAKQLVGQGADIIFNICVFPILRGHWKAGSLVRAFDNFIPIVGANTSDYNALIRERRIHHYGGGSFIVEPPKMLDKDDFKRWIKGLDDINGWVRMELDELEQVYIGDVNLSTVRRFRTEFFDRFGFETGRRTQ